MQPKTRFYYTMIILTLLFSLRTGTVVIQKKQSDSKVQLSESFGMNLENEKNHCTGTNPSNPVISDTDGESVPGDKQKAVILSSGLSTDSGSQQNQTVEEAPGVPVQQRKLEPAPPRIPSNPAHIPSDTPEFAVENPNDKPIDLTEQSESNVDEEETLSIIMVAFMDAEPKEGETMVENSIQSHPAAYPPEDTKMFRVIDNPEKIPLDLVVQCRDLKGLEHTHFLDWNAKHPNEYRLDAELGQELRITIYERETLVAKLMVENSRVQEPIELALGIDFPDDEKPENFVQLTGI